MANASPRGAPAADVARVPAWGSGAPCTACSRATEARSTWTATAPRISGSSDTALPDRSDSRASWASEMAGTTAFRHAASTPRRRLAASSTMMPTMASTSTTISTINPHGVFDEVFWTTGGVVVEVVLDEVVVVRGSVADVAGWITPRIGGVGPMTRAMLLINAVRAAERAL
jgi:hypothetical protein